MNAAWSYFFFTRHWIGLAVILWFAWRIATADPARGGGRGRPLSFIAILLFPYLGWVSFATFLTYVIYRSN